jgi:hypothetical protein
MGIAVAVVLPDLPVQAEGKLNIVAKFESANLGLDVVTYINPTASPSRIALLGFRSASARTSFVFSLNEWVSLFDLWATTVSHLGWTVGLENDGRFIRGAQPDSRERAAALLEQASLAP